MERKCLNISLFSIFTSFCLLWGVAVLLPTTAQAESVGTITTNGDCEINEETKKQMAQQGKEAAQKVQAAITFINNSIEKDYKADSGKCHFLKDKFWSSVAKWWGEVFRAGLDFDDHIATGAVNADKLLNDGKACEDLIKYANDNNDYTDWDTADLESRVLAAKRELQEISNWAKEARPGDFKQVDAMDARSAIERAMGMKCSRIFVHYYDSTGYLDKCRELTGAGSSLSCLWATGEKKEACEGFRSCEQNGWESGALDVEFDCQDTNAIRIFSDGSHQGTVCGRKQFMALLGDNDAPECIKVLSEMNRKRKEMTDNRVIVKDKFGVLSGELNANCTCEQDETGRLTGNVGECDVLDPDFVENNIEVCPTVEEYRATFSKVCVTCGLFAKILAAAQNIADGTFAALSGPLSQLLCIGFLIFIGYTTLLHVANPEPQKSTKYLTTLMKQGFKVALTLLILATPKFIYTNAAEPLLDGSVDFGVALSQTSKQDFVSRGGEYSSNFKSDSYMSSNILTTMVGAMAGFNETAATMPAIGASLWCNAWIRLGISRGFFMPRFTMAIEGVFFIAFGFMIMFALGFYLLDAGIQLGICCGMMPFFIACWPFKMTTRYTKVGWNMFLNTCFQFIMMGVVITVIVELVSMSLSGDKSAAETIELLNSGDPDNDMKAMDFGGLQMILAILCCMFALKLAKETGSLANKFAKGSPTNGMGTQMGTLAASAAKYAVKTTAKTSLAVAKASVGGIGGGGSGSPIPGAGGPGGGGMPTPPGGGAPGGGGMPTPPGGMPGGGPGGGGMPTPPGGMPGGGPGGGGMPDLQSAKDGIGGMAIDGMDKAVDKADRAADSVMDKPDM